MKKIYKKIQGREISNAQQIQHVLLDFGYKYIVLCNTHDEGVIITNYYRLLKEEDELYNYGCTNSPKIPLESDTALDIIIDNTVTTIISPNVSSIDTESRFNIDPIVKEEKFREAEFTRVETNRFYLEHAKELQQKLISQGYKSLDYYEEINDTTITREYTLSKGDGIAKPDRYFEYNTISIETDEATQIFYQWLWQISIYPDPRTL
jgi:hypothetical protein